MSISLIAAVSKNNVIGKENALPWYLPEDLKRFRELTTGKTILMGRKTFESILKRNGKPLPNRKNIVVTTQQDYQVPPGVIVYHDLNTAIQKLKNEEVFVIGGGEIFRQTIDLADTMYITHVEQEVEGDVLFPVFDLNQWRKIGEEKHPGFSLATYARY